MVSLPLTSEQSQMFVSAGGRWAWRSDLREIQLHGLVSLLLRLANSTLSTCMRDATQAPQSTSKSLAEMITVDSIDQESYCSNQNLGCLKVIL